MGKFDDLADAGRKIAALVSPPRPNVSNMSRARRLLPVAVVDVDAGTIDARGARMPGGEPFLEDLAEGVGKHLQQNADTINGVSQGIAGFAYKKGLHGTRRHELFHSMVDHARHYPNEPLTPEIDALASVQNLLGQDGFTGGIGRIAEEVAASRLGKGADRGRALDAYDLSDIGYDYGRTYHKQGGLAHALPAYALGAAYDPVVRHAAGGLATLAVTGAGAMQLGDWSQKSLAADESRATDDWREEAARRLINDKERALRQLGLPTRPLYHAEGRDGEMDYLHAIDGLIERLNQ